MATEQIGQAVAKQFPGFGTKKFKGTVVAFDSTNPEDGKVHHIKYEDGDEEWVTDAELKEIMVPDKGAAKASGKGAATKAAAKPAAKPAKGAAAKGAGAKASSKEAPTKEAPAAQPKSKAAGMKRKGAEEEDAAAAAGEDGAAGAEKAAGAAAAAAAAPEEAPAVTQEEKEEKKFTGESKQPRKAGAGAKKKKVAAAAAAAPEAPAPTAEAGAEGKPAVPEVAAQEPAEDKAAAAEAAQVAAPGAAAGEEEGEAGPSTLPAAGEAKPGGGSGRAAAPPASDLTTQAVAGSQGLQELIAEVAARSKARALNVVRYGPARPATAEEEEALPPLQSQAVTCGDVCYISTIFPREVKRVHVEPEPPQEEVEAEYANQAEQVLAELERQLEQAGTSKEHLIFVNVMLREIDKGTPPFKRVWNKWVTALPALWVMESFMDNECLVAATAQAAVPPATF